MKIKLHPLTVEREELVNLARILCTVIDDKPASKSVRGDAEYWFSVLNETLLYDPPGGERSISLIPIAFHERDYYQTWVEQFIAELPDDVKADVPGQLALARHFAQLTDRQGASSDFRLDALDVLEDAMARLSRINDSTEEFINERNPTK